MGRGSPLNRGRACQTLEQAITLVHCRIQHLQASQRATLARILSEDTGHLRSYMTLYSMCFAPVLHVRQFLARAIHVNNYLFLAFRLAAMSGSSAEFISLFFWFSL